ncbi:MAG: Asp23/Gls24 family envelope stress response protein [Oscillospiraceae bacterium]
MISFENTLGKVSMTAGYFAELVSRATQSGFGVAGMTANGASDSLKTLIMPNFPEKGVRVTEEGGRLVIDLHIKVTYGLNIAAAVKSITHNVQYVLEQATGLSVKRINVSVDDVVA